ncbi:(deoxy)nucleoside triphosphate pyrophosphohydrolase [Elizabethkingia anophelis]|uniref:8-oxo-dGTP diphosphatase n=1 Tax=Elizabethkingia anophelis TaxID=1117645 RepID=A0A7Z7PX55_9FLAO|nr:(deoxy)nucleoside triphosphate pyrophosphohydrolase [Elizabethkingia anophelis]MCT3631296.1 (deoxy)nucleoside triphosphate pyrophosphohydrolase [Elizabethkingia anophelis]MCT3634913.1 (deoxy)nucleoside triphosphate pyrophosphohydrolase [Elizabethkingia anophelis]MCT3831537.1 (deoxy)nucleoside triphosphate pyrophosphohydrolase [Elizabethkingia anophelis]MCT3885015.1 (deoxy)nucleoside triphosphate pyrophosphohydrolase [Elizabethkingia anophelis]MCT3895884.1 (deoxy)nucleoside triphosphate pyro
MGTIRVVCGVIFNEGRILLCRRKPEKSLGGYWEFPGGKIEVGETEEESLYRELQEELGIRVEIERYFKSVVHDYDGFTIELIAYICRSGQSVCVLTDHDEYQWVDKSELLNWKLAPADVPIANELCFMEQKMREG